MSSGAGLNGARAAASLGTPALWLTGAERWLLLIGLSIALGGLAGRGLARQYLARDDTPAAPARLPLPWALRGPGPVVLIRPAQAADRDQVWPLASALGYEDSAVYFRQLLR